MKNLQGFYSVLIAAVVALLLQTAPCKAQFQPQTFSSPSSFGRAFYYRPYDIPFRMPPGLNYAYVHPNAGTLNYTPRFYQPGGYPSSNYTPFYTSYPPLYVPNVPPYSAPITPSTVRVY